MAAAEGMICCLHLKNAHLSEVLHSRQNLREGPAEPPLHPVLPIGVRTSSQIPAASVGLKPCRPLDILPP